MYGGQVRREPDNYSGYSDHRPDLAVLLDGELTVFGLKVFDPIGSLPADASERGAHVALCNTMEHANDVGSPFPFSLRCACHARSPGPDPAGVSSRFGASQSRANTHA